MNKPTFFAEAYGIDSEELDFFDLNLETDTKLFIDPFLIRRSPKEIESQLFNRFGDFFRYAYDKSLTINEGRKEYRELKSLLNFHEPKEIGLGWSEDSNSGSGPGPSFAQILFKFFVSNSARRLVKEEGLFPDGRFNPVTLEIFIDKLGPDGLSDITANLIMDYLVQYTQEQCKKHGVPLKTLPLQQDGFDFEEMEWKGGGYYELPENKTKEGEAVILIPKRFLRSTEMSNDHINSKVKGILQLDPELSSKFSQLVGKSVSEIDIEDIRKVFLEEDSVFTKYLTRLNDERNKPYDFDKDVMKLFAVKSYKDFFKDININTELQSCDDLYKKTLEFIQLFNDHCSRTDGWKEMWSFDIRNQPDKPKMEAVISRIFRAMGYAYFSHFPSVAFDSESGTGNGSIDFKISHLDCIIVIEIKRLLNSSPKGTPPIPSYIHGLVRQLPDYAYLKKASYAIYITAQHYSNINRPRNSHDLRIDEIKNLVPEVENRLKKELKSFKELKYINVSLVPRGTASTL